MTVEILDFCFQNVTNMGELQQSPRNVLWSQAVSFLTYRSWVFVPLFLMGLKPGSLVMCFHKYVWKYQHMYIKKTHSKAFSKEPSFFLKNGLHKFKILCRTQMFLQISLFLISLKIFVSPEVKRKGEFLFISPRGSAAILTDCRQHWDR